jgi:hypothetical protein
MTTYRERREANVERLRGWAARREANAEAAGDATHEMSSVIPLGQRILVGHHSERPDRYCPRPHRWQDGPGARALAQGARHAPASGPH